MGLVLRALTLPVEQLTLRQTHFSLRPAWRHLPLAQTMALVGRNFGNRFSHSAAWAALPRMQALEGLEEMALTVPVVAAVVGAPRVAEEATGGRALSSLLAGEDLNIWQRSP